jgi:hypothetical protein
MQEPPDNHQKCEILVNGEWIEATFFAADYIPTDDDEVWWMDYFLTENLEQYPDAQSGAPLPLWRVKTPPCRP